MCAEMWHKENEGEILASHPHSLNLINITGP